ncbi:MCE family protein [Actinospongicola halichondriae]|uniref:MCE family protein n=1 Tax=Actinospongicola halichondriae TaxID=3236844 RepID=UPI003D44BDF3
MAISTERNRNMISGAIGMVILLALISVGIKASFGAFDGGYRIQGSFAAAGQGLLAGSDVKVRGVNIGEVSKIELVDNRALVTMRINDGRDIPVDAQAVIRPKTLFGEKFVDVIPGDSELSGPYLETAASDDCPTELPCITDTLGGFELERVLADTYPVLKAIDPAELALILDELANAGDGLGGTVNRSIVNSATLSELAASNDAEFRQFTSDLALLSETLDEVAPDLLRGARDLNVALPSLNARGDELNTALVQLGRLSGDLADLLENNVEFTTNALTNGSKSLDLLFNKRNKIQPLLLGLEQYTSTLAEAIRIEAEDGSMMAAVKNLVSVSEILAGALPAEAAAAESPAPAASTPAPLAPLDELQSVTTKSTSGLLDLLLGGGR